MMRPEITLAEAEAIVATKVHPRVTKESIEAKVQNVEFVHHSQMTIATITMFNGFMVTGVSAPASVANFDREVGKRYAYDNAFKQLWQLEGYLLREKLSQEV
jgi:hypothetical protein